MARAEEPPGLAPPVPVAFGADEVHFDARAQALEITGHVHVDEPPFHLASDALALRRVPIGAELTGTGTLAFCPCLGTPLGVRFTGATVAPPHDLVLRNPVLEVFGVPVAWAPVLWLRDASRFGLLPPDVEWRGADGLFAGGGVHVPWTRNDTVRGLDVRAGGYVDGGFATEAALRTATTATSVRVDDLRGDTGVGVAAHGGAGDVSWGVDALRGARAVRATTDLDAAARPFDRAGVEATWRDGGWTFASGVRDVALRGGALSDVGAGGPVVAARRADALGSAGAYDATVEGGAVSAAGLGTTTFARAEGGTLLAAHAGSFLTSLAVRALGDVADDGLRSGLDGAAQARASASLPLSRAFASPDHEDPWIHRTEPRVELAALASHAGDVLVVPAGRGMVVPGSGAWVAAAGWSNAFGRWAARTAAVLDVSAGAVGDDRSAFAALRARASASAPLASLQADFARVAGPLDAASGALPASGGALVARGRLGPATGLHLTAHVAERDGVDPLVARALVDAPLEPASGFLALSGWTGGARLAVPVGPRVTTRGGADADFSAPGGAQLVAAVGALELHDPCGCVVVRATAAHRIGRDGVDVWLTVDLPR
ncbi:MAG TPA: hypothetical protein VIF09_02535 [Polyangiaceae bacterium]